MRQSRAKKYRNSQALSMEEVKEFLIFMLRVPIWNDLERCPGAYNQQKTRRTGTIKDLPLIDIDHTDLEKTANRALLPFVSPRLLFARAEFRMCGSKQRLFPRRGLQNVLRCFCEKRAVPLPAGADGRSAAVLCLCLWTGKHKTTANEVGKEIAGDKQRPKDHGRDGAGKEARRGQVIL